MIKIKRALISVYDKRGIIELASGLSEFGVEMISTGGSARLLKEGGFPVTAVSEITGFPEILEGRVKTLTPQIHGGILAKRDKADHLRQIGEHHIEPIDMVVVNLYPFEEVIKKPLVSLEEAIENIDIGGPAMLRSAAKNNHDVVVICDPSDYGELLSLMRQNNGCVSRDFSFKAARKVFMRTSQYDETIQRYLENVTAGSEEGFPSSGGDDFPQTINLDLHRIKILRYGENPHQKGALYESPSFVQPGLTQAEILQGKTLSFNNYLDLDSAQAIVFDFEETAVAILKHTNPCGTAIGDSIEEAFRKALEADPVSSYGGIVGCNDKISASAAEAMSEIFLEAIIAPDYDEKALKIFAEKKNLRILKLQMPTKKKDHRSLDLRSISGGFLLQDLDCGDILSIGDLEIVSKRMPTETEYAALFFAWKMVRHLKSNAVAFASPNRMLSAGFGQASRVESVRLALERSHLPLEGSALASDAFFPFRDGLDQAADAGATAIIQPGGSIRDKEVIAAADERDLAMVFTGKRHFKH